MMRERWTAVHGVQSVAVRQAEAEAAPAPRSRMVGWVRAVASNEWAMAAAIFVFTRAVALVPAYVGVTRLIAAEPQRNKGWFAELALMWDAAWYARIVQDGYAFAPGSPDAVKVAFAPLYPFLVRLLSDLLGWLAPGWDWGDPTYGRMIVAGLAISNVSFFVALALLIRLLAPRLGRAGAGVVALALASLPTAFFFSAMYTEGLFLLLLVSTFLIARSDWKHKWLAASMLASLAALVRFVGVLLLVVLAVEYLSQVRWQWRRVRADVLCVALVLLGVGLYGWYMWSRFGSPLAPVDSQLHGWDRQASFFLDTYWQSAVQLWQSVAGAVPPDRDPVLHYGMGDRLYLFLDLGMPAALLAGGLLARRRLKASEWAWLVLGIVYPLSAGFTFSMARYVLPLWPGLVWLGTLEGKKRWVAVVWLAASLALLARCSYIYASAHWIG